ncbi:uncharacterized protein C8orf76 homolog [Phyllobates terribilis]|uniref:uncharacterized protein C8orf76 homolog n=1 Tax=Phyllobates terribilis TaxID=111132 RepID=UPI003CCA7140
MCCRRPEKMEVCRDELWMRKVIMETGQEKAFNVSSDCSALIPLANTAMRSDVQESQARGLLRLGRRKEALESAELLAMELETL